MPHIVVRYIGGPLHGQFARQPPVLALAGVWHFIRDAAYLPVQTSRIGDGPPTEPSLPPIREHRYRSLGRGSRGAVVMLYFGRCGDGVADFQFPDRRRGDVA